MATFKPLGNRVVIKPSEGEEQMSAGGIYIPGHGEREAARGRGSGHRAGQAVR